MNLQEIPENTLLNNLPSASVFKTRLDTLQQTLPSILDDFKKYYLFTNNTPEYEEYQQIFQKIKNNLQIMLDL